ncbi:MAG TPA: hypothetical protein ENI22_02755 [Candidatus Pacearchaeota archaeon]|nr:hypothetical protein [Candidatus Pacearchaeota archaeon]
MKFPYLPPPPGVYSTLLLRRAEITETMLISSFSRALIGAPSKTSNSVPSSLIILLYSFKTVLLAELLIVWRAFKVRFRVLFLRFNTDLFIYQIFPLLIKLNQLTKEIKKSCNNAISII